MKIVRAAARALASPDPLSSLEAALGGAWPWQQPLVERFQEAFPATRPRIRDVEAFLRADALFQQAIAKHRAEIHPNPALLAEPAMQPIPAASQWDLPKIPTPVALADWLCLAPSELDWLADLRGLNAAPRLVNYRYLAEHKRSGGVRLIEAPKSRLKAAQRRILDDILTKIPPHPAAHGFVRTRSIRTFAQPHTSQSAVLKLDLENFFPGIHRPRIDALFRTLGYPETVAASLAGLCTNAVPAATCRALGASAELYARPHLPQGAPTSPALANVCAYRADCRLTGLANSSGLVYTRYADDLAFSGTAGFARSAKRFAAHAAVILLEEGFRVNHRKTRLMRQGVRQRLTGLTVNQRLNIARSEFDALKATLTNCVHHGPESQNREAHPHFHAHLAGRIAFFESINPAKAQRLLRLFGRIDWPGST